MVVEYIQNHWAELMSGKELEIQYGILKLKKSVTFKLYRSDDKIVMKISNVFLRVLVDPIEFKFSKDGKKVLSMSGRVLPLDGNKDSVSGIDGEMVFNY